MQLMVAWLRLVLSPEIEHYFNRICKKLRLNYRPQSEIKYKCDGVYNQRLKRKQYNIIILSYSCIIL